MDFDLESILEDTQCSTCLHIGMESYGGYDYECPTCGTIGTLLDEDDEYEDDEYDGDELCDICGFSEEIIQI